MKQEIALKAVNAEVSVAAWPGGGVSHKGKRRTTEVERIAICIEDDLHDVRIANLSLVQNRRGSSDHADRRLITQFPSQFVDESR